MKWMDRINPSSLFQIFQCSSLNGSRKHKWSPAALVPQGLLTSTRVQTLYLMVLEMHYLESALCFQRCQVVCRKQDQAHKASTAQDSGQGVCGPEMSTAAPPGREDLCSAFAISLLMCSLLIYALRTFWPRCFMVC